MWGRLLVKPNHVSDFRWDSWTGTCNKWEKFSSFKHVLKEHEKNKWKKYRKNISKNSGNMDKMGWKCESWSIFPLFRNE